MARYALTVFLSAFLLFQVQPLIAKYILPWFGGGSSVWTTCMLFFQMLLLVGYAYAHLLSTKLRPSRQGLVHLILVVASLLFLPIQPSQDLKPIGGASPIFGIFLLLSATVGVPFFLLSATGPLMQRWFSRMYPGRSPYRLYSLSNFGSLLALLSYPFVFEPSLRLFEQISMWSFTYAVFVALAVWCSLQVILAHRYEQSDEEADGSAADESGSPEDGSASNEDGPLTRPGFGLMCLWLGLAAAGSAMLLATTNQMCIDVAVVPFLWVLPLSLYLLSFVICFDNPRWYDRRVFGLLLVPAGIAACWQLHAGLNTSIPIFVAVYSIVMFVSCMTCHGELMHSRPHPSHLTLFYLLVAAGGALGGLFVAVVSPMFFTAFWEYHVAVAGVCGVTVMAWSVGGVWRVRASLVFWIWTLVSIIQIWLVNEVFYRKHAAVFVREDESVLFGGLGLFYVIGLLVTSYREQSARLLGMIWGTITICQFVWVMVCAESRFPELVEDGQYWIFGAGSILMAGLGVFSTRWVASRWNDVMQQWVAVIGLQISFFVGLFVLWNYSTISNETCVKLLGAYVSLWFAGWLAERIRPNLLMRDGVWFLTPLCLAWAVLSLELYQLAQEDRSDYVHTSRNFYGVLSVALYGSENGNYHSLMHGQIEHGNQYNDETWSTTPTTYYGAGTGIELALRLHPRRQFTDPEVSALKVGVVGLGCGTIAAHGKPGDHFRFYEINPDVLALSDKYFTYLRDSAAETEVVLGDARITMDQELVRGDPQLFDVLAIDAFSSDAIPLHLLTREAAELYRRHLAEDGILLVHISNRYLDLDPVTLGLAQSLGWRAVRIDNDEDEEIGLYSSSWVAITSNEEFLAETEVLDATSFWEDEEAALLWTDDFASLWQVISY